MKKIQILIYSAFLTLMVLACSKGEQGDVGPAGVAGAKGAIGDKGDIGITNSKGMLYSSWFTAKTTDWDLFAGTTNAYNIILETATLTPTIASKGGLYAYMQPIGSTVVYPLPYRENNVLTMYCLVNLANSQPGVLFGLKFDAASAKVTSEYKLRFVFVPAAARMSADVDWNNYEDVKKYLNLND